MGRRLVWEVYVRHAYPEDLTQVLRTQWDNPRGPAARAATAAVCAPSRLPDAPMREDLLSRRHGWCQSARIWEPLRTARLARGGDLRAAAWSMILLAQCFVAELHLP